MVTPRNLRQFSCLKVLDTPLIKSDIMIVDYDQGGLKMVVAPLFAKSLKSTWIKKYLDQNNRGKWKLFFAANLRDLGATIIFKGNLIKKHLSMTGKTDTFLQELLQIWSEITFEDMMVSTAQLRSQLIWLTLLYVLKMNQYILSCGVPMEP